MSGGTSSEAGGMTEGGAFNVSGGASVSNTSGGAGASSGSTTSGAPGVVEPPPGEYGSRKELLAANSEMAVAELDGKIYVIGGYPSNRTPQSSVQVYDTESDSWDYAAELPFALHHPVAVGAAGRVFSLGGQLANGDTDRVLAYEPATDLWTDRAPMPTARGAGAGAVLGDVIYVIAGRPPSAGNAFEAYDIGDDRWTSLPDLPQTFPDRNHIAAAAIAGKIYVAGGRYGGGGFADPRTASLDIYDPVTGRWSTGTSMLRPRGGVNGVAAHGCFFVWGGEGSGIGEPNDVFPDMDVYAPGSDRWTSLPALPTPVHGVTGAAFVGGLIYIPGGGTTSGGSSGSRLFQVYRPNMRCD
jgi:N-acetylneuraminic acid mutarotase